MFVKIPATRFKMSAYADKILSTHSKIESHFEYYG